MASGMTHRHTLRASYLGYITQAIVNNFAPLLFITFQKEFSLSVTEITFLTTLNFAVQLLVDLLSTFFVDRIGYRKCVVAAHLFCVLGLAGLTVFPLLLPALPGLLLAVTLYAIGGGLIEVLISPIVESCPTEGKEAAMSLLHSFYCWGHAGVVLLSTAYFSLAGIGLWRGMALLFALIPLLNSLLFTKVPLYPIVAEKTKQLTLRQLFTNKVFFLVLVMMVCSGAGEQAMSQWSSVFAEAGLRVDKTLGDLLGPCAFALCMGTARALYGRTAARLPLNRFMAASCVMCVCCYLIAALASSPLLALAGCALCGFSVGIFWPGTFSLAAKALPGGGTAMYALLALGGDLGCSGGPTLVGLIAGSGTDLRLSLLWGILAPVLLLLCLGLLNKTRPAKA